MNLLTHIAIKTKSPKRTLLFLVMFFLFQLGSTFGYAEENKVDSKCYTYIDVMDGFFPIPRSLLAITSSISQFNKKKSGYFEYRVVFLRPHDIDPSIFEGCPDYQSTTIEVRSPVDMPSEAVNSELLQFEEDLAAGGLKYKRYSVKSNDSDLDSLKDSCVDRFFFKKVYIQVLTPNCKLSEDLGKHYVPAK